jgi:hypothetical protein
MVLVPADFHSVRRASLQPLAGQGRGHELVVDPEIATATAPVGRSWQRTFDVVDLPPLPAPTSPEFSALFAKKMAVCEEFYGFVGEPREQPPIDNKTKTLHEVPQSFGSGAPLQDCDYALLFHMIEVNM